MEGELGLLPKGTIRKIRVGERIYYDVDGVHIPAELGWFAVILALMKRGYKLRFHYGRQVTEKPIYFEFERDLKGFAPRIPDRIEVFKEEEVIVKHELNPLLRPRKVKKLMKVLDISSRSLFDPDPIESLELFSAVV